MELDEYARLDGVGLREHLVAGEVSAAELEAVARQALDLADTSVNGLAQPVFSTVLSHADDGPFGGVPFLLKDNPMAEGVEFFIGSRSLNAIAEALPLFTTNPKDFSGLDSLLTVVPVDRPQPQER